LPAADAGTRPPVGTDGRTAKLDLGRVEIQFETNHTRVSLYSDSGRRHYLIVDDAYAPQTE